MGVGVGDTVETEETALELSSSFSLLPQPPKEKTAKQSAMAKQTNFFICNNTPFSQKL